MVRSFFSTGLVAALMLSPYTDAKAPGGERLTSLAESLEPLRERFNADAGKLRVVAILSPT